MAEESFPDDIAESLANMEADNVNDLDLEEMLNSEDLAGARQRLLEMLEKGELPEELRENLQAMLAGNMPLFGGYGGVSGVLLAFGLAILVFSIILFFGYKLYKSIKDKERKKEDKKKAKQQKKKK